LLILLLLKQLLEMLDICFGEARRLAERTSDVSAGLCLCALRKTVADAYL